MFKQSTLARQVEILNEIFKEEDGLKSAIAIMNNAYIRNDMNALQELMYGESYKPEEMKALLDDRNIHWMQQLPNLMKEHQNIIYKLVHLYATSEEDKKDLYQEILLQAWKTYSAFRGDAKFSTWLYRLCLNTIFTIHERQIE